MALNIKIINNIIHKVDIEYIINNFNIFYKIE